MSIFRTLVDRILVRALRHDKYENRFLRRRFERLYGIKIGLYSTGCFDRWRIPLGTTIGRYCSISENARLIDADHPIGALSTHPYFYLRELGVVDTDRVHPVPPIIEDDVWMAHNAVATPDCKRIGRGAIIGAGAVVARNVPRYAIMMGAPAKLVRFRFAPEVIEAIEATQWWLLDKDELRKGLAVANDFLTSPSVESARAFMRALGQSGDAIKISHRETEENVAPSKISPESAKLQESILRLVANEVPAFSRTGLGRSFEEMGIDSLGFLNLRAAIEQFLRRPLFDEDWARVFTPTDLLKLLAGGMAESSANIGSLSKDADVSGSEAEQTYLGSVIQTSSTELYWLPRMTDWDHHLDKLERDEALQEQWLRLVALANQNLDSSETNRIDRLLMKRFGAQPPEDHPFEPIRLAVIGSSTLGHLLPAVRVAGLRRGLHVTAYEGEYGQYFQELSDPGSALYRFKPNIILLSLDAEHLMRGIDAAADSETTEAAFLEIVSHLKQCWQLACEANIPLVQQAVLSVFRPLLGNNEQRLPGSKHKLVARLNALLRELSITEGFDLLAIDSQATLQGLDAWYDPVYWHRAKQEIRTSAAPLYGDLVARLLAARQGRSYKCMVLDLDNTLWGGVIGDDGLDGIVLGQGSGPGEAFLAVQNYALEQAKRGIILAVCSKNDEKNAREPFDSHPDMLLKNENISCFVANWDDKAKNIRRIAQELNIGLDSLVFVDDNPFERNLVRSELPMVAVPELPQDSALYARTLSDAGYFEGVAVTDDDRKRTSQYQANARRAAIQAAASDLPTYLRSLDMELIWSRFNKIGLQRIVQLINKTNQFNLTTRRYTEEDVLSVMADRDAFGLQLRLLDRFGDNGIIAIVIGRRQAENVLIDTWLMSCRVLGRNVEEATLGILVAEAKKWAAKYLVGEYRPTQKNGMVRDHYANLGFAPVDASQGEETRWLLDCESYKPSDLFMKVNEGMPDDRSIARTSDVQEVAEKMQMEVH